MAESNVVQLNDGNFAAEVLQAEGPVLVDFFAVWCGPCKMLGPVIEELANDYQGKAKIGKLNVDESNGTASEYGVMSIPTMVLFVGGKEVNRMVGFSSKEDIAKAIDAVAK